jgi:hypothetical protein
MNSKEIAMTNEIKDQLMFNLNEKLEIYRTKLMCELDDTMSKGWYCDYWEEFVIDETKEQRDLRWKQEEEETMSTQIIDKTNPADKWWKTKMETPIGCSGLFKCNTCRYAYSSEKHLERHLPKCKKPKKWDPEWAIDSYKNRLEWRRSS